MKKMSMVLGVWNVLLLLCILATPVYANENTQETERKPILQVVDERECVDKIIFQTQYYDEELQGYDFTDDVIMKVYFESPWYYAEMDMQKVFDEIKGSIFGTNVILEDVPIPIVVYGQKETYIGCYDKYEGYPTYLIDIKESAVYKSENMIFNGECTKVLCIDGEYYREGIVVYYIGKEQTVVYYYDDYTSSPLEFTLKDFQRYGAAYYRYLSSDELNYDENGNTIGGVGDSFSEFIERGDFEKWEADDNANSHNKWIMIATVAVVIIVIAVLIFFVSAKHRKNDKECFQEEAN